MDESPKHEPQMTFQAAHPTMETHPITVSELLEDSGNCRQIMNLHLLSDSLFSEQQKLRHVLDWAHSFLSSGSEVHREFCRADSLILADEERRETQKTSPAYKHSCVAKYHHPTSGTAGGDEVFGPRIPVSVNSGTDVTCPENRERMKSLQLQDATKQQTTSTDNCRTSSRFISNQRQHTNISDRNTSLASDGATCSIKESDVQSIVFDTASNWRYKTAGALSERDISGHPLGLSKEKLEKEVEAKMEVAKEETEDARMNERMGKNHMSNSEPEKTQEWMEKTSSLRRHLKTPPALTVYEQYQFFVDQLHQLRVRQNQNIEQECVIVPPAKEKSEEYAPENVIKAGRKRVTAAEITKKSSSGVIHKIQDRSEYNRSRTTLTEHGRTKHCDMETPAERVCQGNTITSSTHLGLNKCGELIKGTAGGPTSADNSTPVEHLTAPGQESAALTTNPGLLSKGIEHNPDLKGCQRAGKGQKKNPGGRGASLRLCEKSSVSLSSPTNTEILQRPQSSGENKHTKRHTREDKVKPTSAYRHTHKCFPPAKTHTPLQDDSGPTSPAPGQCKQTDTYRPAGVPVCEPWLCLPDEVWLSILSLLPHTDLCRVLQVCRRLHTLAADHTLWSNLRIENSTLTERWLLCVGRRRPRSLSLYSCSGLCLTSTGLEVFFTLCGNSLEELKVTSCSGPGLHGDQMLPLIGRLCPHVTIVDVSWSGTTDTGVRALSDCCPGLQLKTVVLNGCHITDDPLTKLVMRHKESLCRLEVFGCQFLTPSCLQTVYEFLFQRCPGLQHLNIGQVPKVNAHSLTVMTSLLKCLMSLNLTGLQAVTDATVDTLLQNCVKLQSLSFSSCLGVTDLSLHSISKYTPCIRSLDVSRCKAVTDAGVQRLAMGCRRLQQLDLSSTGTGNRGVSLLANYCSGHLRTVKLSFCHVASENILKLCRHSKRLKVLHLYGCAHLPTERQIREVNATVEVHPLP